MAVIWNMPAADGNIQTLKTLPVNLEKGVPTFLAGANGGRASRRSYSARSRRLTAAPELSAYRRTAMFGRHQAISPYSETHYDVKAFGPVAGQSHLNKMRDMS